MKFLTILAGASTATAGMFALAFAWFGFWMLVALSPIPDILILIIANSSYSVTNSLGGFCVLPWRPLVTDLAYTER